MTTTQTDPQAHASDTEKAIAHLYAAARASTRYGISHATPETLSGWFERQDANVDAVANLATTTASDITIIFAVAKTLQ
jgi:hypothetical protein